MKPRTFILYSLGIFSLLAFSAAVYLDSDPAFLLTAASLVSFVTIFAIEYLSYKVGGKLLTIEKTVAHLETTNTELKKIITALVKTTYIAHETGGRLGGPHIKHKALINKQIEEISQFLNASEIMQVTNKIKVIDDQIQKEKEQKKKSS